MLREFLNFVVFRILLVSFFALTNSRCLSDDLVVGTDKGTAPQLSAIEVLLDSEERFDFESVKREKFNLLSNMPNILLQSNIPMWIKFSITNNKSDIFNWYLTSFSTESPYFKVYESIDNDNFYFVGDFGYKVQNKNRKSFDIRPRVEIHIPKGVTHTFLIKTKYIRLPIVKFDVQNNATTQKHIIYNTGFALFYFGFIFSLVVYNLFLYLRLRDQAYLHYSFFASTMIAAFLGLSGVFDLFGVPKFGSVYWIEMSLPIMVLMSLSALLFCKSFLRIDQFLPQIVPIFKYASYILLLFAVVAFFWQNNTWIPIFITIVNGLTLLAVVVIGFCVYKKGFEPARFYLIGWASFFVFYLVWLFDQGSLDAINYFNVTLPALGNMCEMSIMSLALAHRIKTLQNEATYAKAKSEEGEKNRKLLRLVCHDIANPLSVISGYSNVLYKQDNGEKINRLSRKILKSSNIIKEMLDNVRRMEVHSSGALDLKLSNESLKEIFNEILLVFELKLKEKDVRLNFISKEDFLVRVDRIAFIHEVVANLISNAIKFSPKNSTIDINFFKENNFINLSIKDYGIGMPDHIKYNIFDMFVQTSRVGTDGEPGTGFGMPLAKSFVESLNGTIEVNSKCIDSSPDDHGTEFIIKLREGKEIDI